MFAQCIMARVSLLDLHHSDIPACLMHIARRLLAANHLSSRFDLTSDQLDLSAEEPRVGPQTAPLKEMSATADAAVEDQVPPLPLIPPHAMLSQPSSRPTYDDAHFLDFLTTNNGLPPLLGSSSTEDEDDGDDTPPVTPTPPLNITPTSTPTPTPLTHVALAPPSSPRAHEPNHPGDLTIAHSSRKHAASHQLTSAINKRSRPSTPIANADHSEEGALGHLNDSTTGPPPPPDVAPPPAPSTHTTPHEATPVDFDADRSGAAALGRPHRRSTDSTPPLDIVPPPLPSTPITTPNGVTHTDLRAHRLLVTNRVRARLSQSSLGSHKPPTPSTDADTSGVDAIVHPQRRSADPLTPSTVTPTPPMISPAPTLPHPPASNHQSLHGQDKERLNMHGTHGVSLGLEVRVNPLHITIAPISTCYSSEHNNGYTSTPPAAMWAGSPGGSAPPPSQAEARPDLSSDCGWNASRMEPLEATSTNDDGATRKRGRGTCHLDDKRDPRRARHMTTSDPPRSFMLGSPSVWPQGDGFGAPAFARAHRADFRPP